MGIERERKYFEVSWSQEYPGVDMLRHGDFYFNDKAATGWFWWQKAKQARPASDAVSDRAMAFLVEFEALCQKYQIQPRVARSGALQLHDRQEDDLPMTDDCIEDCLGKTESK